MAEIDEVSIPVIFYMKAVPTIGPDRRTIFLGGIK